MRLCDRTDAPDTVWHVSSRVNWQTWQLVTEHAFHTFVDCFDRALEQHAIDLLAFVLMSNHFHAVLRSPPAAVYHQLTGRRTRCRHFRPYPSGHPKSAAIGQCLQHFKLGVAKRIQRSLDLSGHFWDGKHYRRKLVDTTTLVIAIAYDHRNPVRQAMVARPEDYARSSARWWDSGLDAPLRLCRRPDLPFGVSREALRARLLQFQQDKRLDDAMEAFSKSGLVFGSPEGRAELERLLKAAGLDAATVAAASA
jgi:REP element-mobilizing transposase RayT